MHSKNKNINTKKNIATIGTYPPRKCGIATYAYDLFTATAELPTSGPKSFIIAIDNGAKNRVYPKEVKFVIEQKDIKSYLEAADYINNSGIDGGPHTA